ETNMPPSPGWRASAVAITSSRLISGPSSASAGGSASVPSQCPISWWKTRGSPVMHSNSMKAVHTRLLHLCTRDQARIVRGVILRSEEIDGGRHDQGARGAQREVAGARVAAGRRPVVLVGHVLDARAQREQLPATDREDVARAEVQPGPRRQLLGVRRIGVL